MDDIKLFSEPTNQEIRALDLILSNFQVAFGMMVNGEKSSMCLFNTNVLVKMNLARNIEFQMGSLPTKYLASLLSLINCEFHVGWR